MIVRSTEFQYSFFMSQIIKVSHSPDSDDAFMFYAIKEEKIDLAGLSYKFSADEIQILNDMSVEDNANTNYDVLAVSFHAYPYIAEQFQIINSGASFGGQSYGPRLVSSKFSNLEELQFIDKPVRIAIPGKLTTAYLVMQIIFNKMDIKFEPYFCNFDKVFSLLEDGTCEASLLIHESQLKFADMNLNLLLDTGAWWFKHTNGLSLPLGTNVISRNIDFAVRQKVAKTLKKSIKYGLEHISDVVAYSADFAQNGLDSVQARQYIDMYVNDTTQSLSVDDRKSIDLLYDWAYQYQILPSDLKFNLDILS